MMELPETLRVVLIFNPIDLLKECGLPTPSTLKEEIKKCKGRLVLMKDKSGNYLSHQWTSFRKTADQDSQWKQSKA